MDEYTKEKERSTSFDNRAGLFVSALIAIITIFLQIIPFSKFTSGFNSEQNTIIICTTIFVGLLGIALVIFLISFIYLARVLISRPFKRVEFSNLDDDNNNMLEEEIMERAMVGHYNKILLYNVEVNSKKSKLYSIGVLLAVISFVLMLLATIGLLIML